MPDMTGAPRAGLANVKREFSRRLNAAIVGRGLNQSELARRVEKKLQEKDRKAKFGRDSMSGYIRGRNLPSPVVRKALCDVLGMKEEDLMPGYERPMHRSVKNESGFQMTELLDGNIMLRLNEPIDRAIAFEIARLYNEAKTGKK